MPLLTGKRGSSSADTIASIAARDATGTSTFRLRVTRAEVGFDNLVVEHVAGVGGDAAQVLGDAARACLHQWRPSLEKRLLDKAAAAIVKAGDTREVRLSLSKLMGK